MNRRDGTPRGNRGECVKVLCFKTRGLEKRVVAISTALCPGSSILHVPVTDNALSDPNAVSPMIAEVDLEGLRQWCGQWLATLPADATVGLVGTLGAGKTTLVQNIAAHLGIDSADVTSPTFTMMSTYRGRTGGREQIVHHVDAYRIADDDSWDELGLDEILAGGPSWVFIEWADRFAHRMPEDTRWVQIDLIDVARRRVTVTHALDR